MSRPKAEPQILRHARRGYALAMRDAAYLERVTARLQPSLAREPADMWEAIDWIWAEALAITHASGTLAPAVGLAASLLVEVLEGDDVAAARWQDVTQDRLSLGSTLQSHPFPDQAAWLLQKMSRAS